MYEDIGDCICVCTYCGATFWYEERLRASSATLNYHRCCEGGRVDLPPEQSPPNTIIDLLGNKHFMDNIRAYNQMFSMASYGAHIDDAINNGRGPYVFRISGQVYHRIGALCPEEGDPPRYLQLYICDTANEASNRMRYFGGNSSTGISYEVVEKLNDMLNTENELVKLFRTARDKINDPAVPDLKVKLYSVIGTRQYELPTSDTLGAIVYDFGDNTRTDYDLIIECKGGTPQRVNKLHPSYMSLQFPLLFVFGQPGYHPGLTLRDVGHSRGSRTVLPASFTGGPRYMYSHYLDALAICRVHGNPRYFITFTCNSKWPEIRRYLGKYQYLTANDRTDIVARVFYMKLKMFINVLKKEELFGAYTAGLPHCHTLLWIKSASNSSDPRDIDQYVSAELPDPKIDPDGFKVISEMMMHGPCGSVNRDAPCMQNIETSSSSSYNKNVMCAKKFPKPYNERTYFDKDGYVHYRRRDTGISVDKGICRLDNGYVVPYNRVLCLRFHAHINVEWCGWTMLIKYIFKYISKGTDRIAAHIPRPIGNASSSDAQQPSNIDEIQNFVDARFICAHEASWRIFNFQIHFREPAVQILSVHLENICSTDGRHLTYLDFPLEFVWVLNEKRWKRRFNLNKPSIGRLSYMHPAFGEVFFLRMLLCHQKGCTSFKDVMTVNGYLYCTYREACLAMGLLGDDKEWLSAIEEANVSATSAELRTLFSHILMFCDVADPLRLWKQTWKLMLDDIPIRAAATLHMSKITINSDDLEGYVLYELQILLTGHSRNVTDFGLPAVPQNLLDDLHNRLIMEERNYDREALSNEKTILLTQLNQK
ncbi:uncharacterized protein [Rutidosis leptorrhynchoides]|uniref:uncharacterized protein n=1 Tax=Rutidosis leptorrhynchoides TaxID=125765 RepID=UPI003A992013